MDGWMREVCAATCPPILSQDEGRTDLRAHQEYIEYKQQEQLMIANAYTIVHPGTVMIHFDDASPTYTTVVGPWRFEGITSMILMVR